MAEKQLKEHEVTGINYAGGGDDGDNRREDIYDDDVDNRNSKLTT